MGRKPNPDQRWYTSSFTHDATLWQPLREYCKDSTVQPQELVRSILYEWLRARDLIPEDFHYQDRLSHYEECLAFFAKEGKKWHKG